MKGCEEKLGVRYSDASYPPNFYNLLSVSIKVF